MPYKKREESSLLTIPLLAQLLEDDLAQNWRHIFTVINEFRWNPSKREEILREPSTKNPTIRAICASLAEWLSRKEGVTPPAWALKTGPSPQAVYFVPLSARRLVTRAIMFSPADFKKRLIFIAALSDPDFSEFSSESGVRGRTQTDTGRNPRGF